ncbi:hypothetical protein [Pseudomonas sp. o96-267]|uniref:hypothetical protein n=1 Tax=Pseudomonas sp. o96-267 TaxID=2479853 RepID=UPI003532489A
MPDNRPDAATPDLTAFDRLWLCEAVRLTEAHGGLLDDAEANRRAIAAGGSLARRIEARALWLAAHPDRTGTHRAAVGGARQ